MCQVTFNRYYPWPFGDLSATSQEVGIENCRVLSLIQAEMRSFHAV